VVYSGDDPVLVVDAKYKRLAESETGTTRRPQNSDVYELFASMVAHKCQRGLLIYPRVVAEDELGDVNLRVWSVRNMDRPAVVGAVGVDIASITDSEGLRKLDKHLAELVETMLDRY
jgi:hypothetical protein